MIPKRSSTPLGATKGFALIEMVLATIIFGLILASLVDIEAKRQNRTQSLTSAQTFASTQGSFANFVVQKKSELVAAVSASSATDTNVKSYCVVKVTNVDAAVDPGSTPGSAGPNGTLAWSGGAGIGDGKKTCAFDLTLLQAMGFYPKGAVVDFENPELGTGKWRYVAIVKGVRKPGPDGVLGNGDDTLATDELEMLMVAMDVDGNISGLTGKNPLKKNPSFREHLFETAAQNGESSGYIPIGVYGGCQATSTTVKACGRAFSIDLGQWIDPAQFNALKAVLPAS